MHTFFTYEICGITSRLKMSTATHQAARLCIAPKLSYEQAVHRIERYIKVTKDKGMTFTPDGNKGQEYYVDADFAGGWNKADSGNTEAVMSRAGCVLIYENFPV